MAMELTEGIHEVIPAICKCKIGVLPFTYLRIPLGADLRRVATWDVVVERFRKKLLDWKCITMSWAVKVPVTIIKKIDKIRKNFLWGCFDGKRKMAKVRWTQICSPKEKGGVGVVNLTIKNKDLGFSNVKWEDLFVGPLLGCELGILSRFIEKVMSVVLVPKVEDQLLLVHDSKFSVKKLSKLLIEDDGDDSIFAFDKIWNLKVPSRGYLPHWWLKFNVSGIVSEVAVAVRGLLRDAEGMILDKIKRPWAQQAAFADVERKIGCVGEG
ncbi:hypothetical protein J1N35_006126 [Gossypium stocksii]|uniref:Reverse transcriptase zinc-binding domain-containing protein n=1 Tax=Gossypium stocksii TaxID=47602 RepID=A0A9D3WF46_9ROSI|nr:hypothetical protein J1N35_006126 [Gossypium stocksii]